MQAILIFAAVHLMLLLSSINSTAISVAFPKITASYNTTLVLAGWVLSIYQLVAVCSMVLMGKVSDVLGRKKTFLICSGLFIIGSLFAALAPNIQLLIAARFIQSIGAGGFFPTIVGIVVDLFPRHRQQAIGVGMSIFQIGGIIGPNIGSWLIITFGWQSIFWFNVPLGVLAIIPLFFLLKTEPGKKIPIDFLGFGYFSGFIFTFMVGLSQISYSSNNLGWMTTAGIFVVSLIFITLFIKHELKTPAPIIELDLFKLRPFLASNVYNFIYGISIFGFSSFLPLYVTTVYSMTTVQSGYVLMARAIGTIVTSVTSGFFLVRWGYRKPMLLGSILISVCLLILAMEITNVKLSGIEINSIVLVSVIALIMGSGMGVAAPASNNACLDLMPERASTITGVRGMFLQGGGAVSIAIITLILQFMGNMTIGFRVIFIATGLIILLTIPFIFALPDKATGSQAKEKTKT